MTADPEDTFLERALRWRGVEDPCRTCGGSGRHLYSNTSGWRKGVGGASMTWDVCDACWGSGDRYYSGANLRQLADEEEKRVAERTVDLLARSCGATLSSARGDVVKIIDALSKFASKRGQHFMTESLAQGLANVLRRAIGAPEVKIR